MKAKLIIITLAMLALASISGRAATIGTEFTYQGRLTDATGPPSGSYDFTFALHQAPSGGTPIVSVTNLNTAVSNGLFTATLDFGGGIFNGTAYWLQLGVRTNGSITFTPLTPRQPLTPTPYAHYAALAGNVTGTLADARLSANVALRVGGNAFTGNQTISGGKLSLGTTAPTRQLEVHAAGDVEIGLKSTDLNGRLWTLQSSGNGTPGREQTFQIIDRTAGVTRLLIKTNGNVGIGTVNPATALDVNGGVRARGGAPGGFGANNNGYAFSGNGGDDDSGLFSSANGQVEFYGNSLERMRITENGNVGIGTTTPVSALQVNGTVTATGFSGNGAGLANVNADTLGGVSGSTFWRTSGNAGTTAGTHFLGTTDNRALEVKVNGTRALRLEPNTNGAPNVIGGSPNNFALLGVVGATIGGGGAVSYAGFSHSNKVTADFGTVGGGRNNTSGGLVATTVGGGEGNTSSSDSATVGGGHVNTSSGFSATVGGGGYNISSGVYATVGGGQGNASSGEFATLGGGFENRGGGSYPTVGGGYQNASNGDYPTVGGGFQNHSSGFSPTVGGGYRNNSSATYATVAGGWHNTSSEESATVGGGYNNMSTNRAGTVGGGTWNTSGGLSATVGGGSYNLSTGYAATIPGGDDNSATGNYSFAAGRRAKAGHRGAFVWADSQDTDFGSTADNQFNIRALGGVRLSGDTPDISFGTQMRQMLNLSGTKFGIGVQADTLYYRCNSSPGEPLAGFRWYKGGSHSSALGNTGGGTEMMSLTELGLYVRGTFVSVSDRNAKENFQPVDPRVVLDKVAALPLSEWNYKQDTSTRHIGPMAQDFYAAFHVGPDDKHITTVDESGVALAAIQGLNQKVEAEVASLRAENAELKQRLERLEQRMNRENGGAR